jgi:hypothetical protein
VAVHQDKVDWQAEVVGRRQAMFREVNERIEELCAHWDDRAISILCECGSSGCGEHIELTQAEYERLRLYPTHFAVVPGHEIVAFERVVQENWRYVTVEKFGESAAAAIKLDPRRGRQ